MLSWRPDQGIKHAQQDHWLLPQLERECQPEKDPEYGTKKCCGEYHVAQVVGHSCHPPAPAPPQSAQDPGL